jgi:HK97 gp10 family phage protein
MIESNGMTLRGLKEVERALQVLGDKAAKRVVRSAAQAGATKLKRIVIAGAPVSTIKRKAVYGGHKYDYLRKHLKQQIKTTVVKSIESDVKILVHTGDAFWGLFVEKGTKVRANKGAKRTYRRDSRTKRFVSGEQIDRQYKGGIKPQHWMKKAFEGSEAEVLAAVEEKLVQAIIREAGK